MGKDGCIVQFLLGVKERQTAFGSPDLSRVNLNTNGTIVYAMKDAFHVVVVSVIVIKEIELIL